MKSDVTKSDSPLQPDAPRRTMPWLAMIAGVALIVLEYADGNLVSFWSAVGLFVVVLAAMELARPRAR